MSTDRELLELAAKAAGHKIRLVLVNGDLDIERWNPLTDDGDEARLEAMLGLDVRWLPSRVLVGDGSLEWYGEHNGNKQSARRRAGVRAAAEIGRAMP